MARLAALLEHALRDDVTRLPRVPAGASGLPGRPSRAAAARRTRARLAPRVEQERVLGRGGAGYSVDIVLRRKRKLHAAPGLHSSHSRLGARWRRPPRIRHAFALALTLAM
ncbi:hypothetical protein OAN61_00570 [bacterium]|nr:hypothetical protein [bacterium]